MKQLPTIEEFYIEKWGVCPMIEKEIALHSYYEMLSFAKEFATLHVKAALEAVANENPAFITTNNGFVDIKSDNQRILNAYPLDNIK